MRYLWLVLKIVLFILLLAFAASNRHIVDLYLLKDIGWSLPMALALLIFFVVGVVLTLLAMLPSYFLVRRELAAARRELRALQQPVSSAPAFSDDILA